MEELVGGGEGGEVERVEGLVDDDGPEDPVGEVVSVVTRDVRATRRTLVRRRGCIRARSCGRRG